MLALDTETSGLDWAHSDRVHVIGALSSTGEEWWLFREDFPKILPVLDAHDIIVGHNIKFDAHMLKREGIELPWNKTHDTLIMAALLCGDRKSKSLLSLSMDYLEYDGFEDLAVADWLHSHRKKKGDIISVPPEVLHSYTMKQLANTLCLYVKFEEAALAQRTYENERQLSRVLFEMEERGALIDRRKLKVADVAMLKKAHRLRKQMDTAGIPEFANLNSAMQMDYILKEMFGIRLPRTAKGKPSMRGEVLDTLPANAAVSLWREHRKLEKLHSTFVVNLEEMATAQNLVHTDYSNTTAWTGRLASSKPNLQNLPRDVEDKNDMANYIRGVFVSRPGFRTFSFDYKQLELTVAVGTARDKSGIKILDGGADVHDETARALFTLGPKDKVTKEQRILAKNVNFGILYGAGIDRISAIFQCTPDQAREFMSRYWRKFPGVRSYRGKLFQQIAEGSPIENAWGRQYQLDKKHSYKAINAISQGGAAEIVKHAMVTIEARLRGTGAAMLLQIHDELVVEFPSDRIDLIPVVQEILEHAADNVLPIRLRVTVAEWSPSWANEVKLDSLSPQTR